MSTIQLSLTITRTHLGYVGGVRLDVDGLYTWHQSHVMTRVNAALARGDAQHLYNEIANHVNVIHIDKRD